MLDFSNLNSFDFLGFLHTYFFCFSYTNFYGYKIRIFTKEMVTKIRMSYVWKIHILRIPNLKLRIHIRISYVFIGFLVSGMSVVQTNSSWNSGSSNRYPPKSFPHLSHRIFALQPRNLRNDKKRYTLPYLEETKRFQPKNL